MSLVRKLVYACVPVLLLLGLGEGVARLADAGGMILYPTEGNCHRRSMLLGEELRPHCTASVGGTLFHTNALGLRDAEVEEDGRQRILAIGDSCTFGWGVADGETYPEQLEVWIRTRCPTCGRVVNGGLPGYTTYQGMIQARDLGNRLRPKTVIAAFGLNDALLDGAQPGATTLPPPIARTSAVAGWLYEWFHRPGTGWWDAVPRAGVNWPRAQPVLQLRPATPLSLAAARSSPPLRSTPRGSNPGSGTLKICVLQLEGALLPRCRRIRYPGNVSLTPHTLSSTGLGITEYML